MNVKTHITTFGCLLPLFQLLDYDPVYLRGDTVLDEAGKAEPLRR